MAPSPGDPSSALAARLEAALRDPEARLAQHGLREAIALGVGPASAGLVPGEGGLRAIAPAPAGATVRLSLAPEAWTAALAPFPRPGFHSVTALRRGGHLRVEGDPLAFARCLFLLERLLELLRGASPRPAAPSVKRDVGLIAGRYHRLAPPGQGAADVFAESSGAGVPVVFLHTAGADARQWGALLADADLAAGHRLHAFDLPFHGRTLPPEGWDGGAPLLGAERYLAWCTAFLEEVVREPAIVSGCSMGAAMALVLAAERPALVRGVVAVEAPFRATGRLNPALAHPEVNAAAHNPSYVRGLMAPAGSEAARRAALWIYAQGAYGVYAGDLAFYEAFDGGAVAPRIDGARCPVAFLAGAYDYSATPDDARRLAALIPGATVDVMDDLGHFPMVEDPDRFRLHFVPALERVGARSAR